MSAASASVAETNRIRAELGLPPLHAEATPTATDTQQPANTSHLATAAASKASSNKNDDDVSSLAAPLESAAAFAARLAAAKSKQSAADSAPTARARKRVPRLPNDYSTASTNDDNTDNFLLTHSAEALQQQLADDKDVILTLKDRSVLDETEEDELESSELSEAQKQQLVNKQRVNALQAKDKRYSSTGNADDDSILLSKYDDPQQRLASQRTRLSALYQQQSTADTAIDGKQKYDLSTDFQPATASDFKEVKFKKKSRDKAKKAATTGSTVTTARKIDATNWDDEHRSNDQQPPSADASDSNQPPRTATDRPALDQSKRDANYLKALQKAQHASNIRAALDEQERQKLKQPQQPSADVDMQASDKQDLSTLRYADAVDDDEPVATHNHHGQAQTTMPAPSIPLVKQETRRPRAADNIRAIADAARQLKQDDSIAVKQEPTDADDAMLVKQEASSSSTSTGSDNTIVFSATHQFAAGLRQQATARNGADDSDDDLPPGLPVKREAPAAAAPVASASTTDAAVKRERNVKAPTMRADDGDDAMTTTGSHRIHTTNGDASNGHANHQQPDEEDGEVSDVEQAEFESESEDELGLLHDEPDLATGGMAAALRLAQQRAMLGKGEAVSGRYNDRPAERSTVTSEYDIVRMDEFGRRLTPKEAFRQMSYVFHGKGPGRKATEKKLKRIAEETKQRKAAETGGQAAKLLSQAAKQGQAHTTLDEKLLQQQISKPKKQAGVSSMSSSSGFASTGSAGGAQSSQATKRFKAS